MTPRRAVADLAPAGLVAEALDELRAIARHEGVQIVPGSIRVIDRAELPDAGPPGEYEVYLHARVITPSGRGGDLCVAWSLLDEVAS
jgi:hypothetical protein